MKYFFGGLLISILLFSLPTTDSYADNHLSDLQALIAQRVQQVSMAGVVLVARGDEPELLQAFNVDATRSDFEIDIDSAFAIASLTKSFTAVLVLQQVERGHIQLDAPISRYLPEFEAEYAGVVTVRQLLQNRSGIPHYVDLPGWFDPEIKGAYTAQTFLHTIAVQELRFTPGEDYYYSNANYYLLGLILEAVTGRRYEALLRANILDPLALNATGQLYEAGAQQVAPTFLRRDGHYESVTVNNPRLFRATASQYASAHDLFIFSRGLMQNKLLGGEMRNILLDPDYAMAFTVAAIELSGRQVPVITYNGELAGTTSMLTILPEQDGVIVVLSNNNTTYAQLVDMTVSFAQAAFAD